MSFPPDYAGARVYPSPNHNARRLPVSAIILHYTGMATAQSAIDLLCSEAAQVSSHYVVDEDGATLQLVPEDRRAWHAGKSFWAGETDLNSASIGIEIVHPGHGDPRPYPRAQILAVAALCRDICSRHAIPRERVLAHSDIALARKIDPGEFFPWSELARLGVGHVAPTRAIGDGAALSLGDAGEAVGALQRQLGAYGYDVCESAVYDAATRDAVTAFQRHFRPERVDGIADASTQGALADLLASLGRPSL